MKHNYIPTCYFPSTVMFIDDSRDFLLNFTLQLDSHLAYRLFDSPYDALDAIHTAHQPGGAINQRCITEYLDASGCPMTNYTVNVDLAAIHWEVYNPQRFSEISVIVIDYAMPGMNGLELCKKMENSPIKRILLTGRADEKTAVEAFNEGIIDLYIQKQNPNLTQVINSSIANMQLHYFQNMSDVIVRMLSVNSPSCLQDRAFCNMFNKIKEENNIAEYYLSENSGSFVMLDADANISFLIVKTQQDLRLHYEMALDNKVPQVVLEQLQKGEKIPYFWQSNKAAEWDEWSTYLYPASKLEGKEVYYYAFIKPPTILDIRRDKILPYNVYLKNLDTKIISR